MTDLLTECQTHFHCIDLYAILGVKKECTSAELRKAFYKMSLLHHPDKHNGELKKEATAQFQVLSKVYAILSDDEKRKVYDETGIVDEDSTITSKSYEDWIQYWQLMFPRVTTKQIDEFREKYRNSESELNDLADIYERCKGDMDVILETLLFASYEDEARIRRLVDTLIKQGRVQAYSQFMDEHPSKKAKRAKKALKEEKLFACEQKSRATDESLVSAILANRDKHLKSTDELLDRLAEKYCKKSAEKRTKSRSSVVKKK
ncbi:hypothetical protein T265_15586 [Opisthorchis viverrini]|uniref:J domain-containing protein n=2 Tax=Opisthorchis viverrini TaxID=6198 RepID=A0A074YWX4_OPIVI|nr:hypothetical protein T265_15586 [Opisthorchis viverrini]KER19306.1 hypothetical protein T265_15586 [Opisthorchis viverrini]